jgi:hypothetical protein
VQAFDEGSVSFRTIGVAADEAEVPHVVANDRYGSAPQLLWVNR